MSYENGGSPMKTGISRYRMKQLARLMEVRDEHQRMNPDEVDRLEKKRIEESKRYERDRERILARRKELESTNPDLYKRRLLAGARSRAKRNGIEFDIEMEDMEWPEKCPVLDLDLKYLPSGKGPGIRTLNTPSIDRVNNNSGYVKGNVQVISWRANKLKQDGTLDEFKRIVDWMEEVIE